VYSYNLILFIFLNINMQRYIKRYVVVWLVIIDLVESDNNIQLWKSAYLHVHLYILGNSDYLSNDLLFLSKLALLQAHENVFVAGSRNNIVSDNHLSVLLCAHSQVDKVGVSLIQLLQCGLGLHDEVCNESRVLDGGDGVLRESLNWDAYLGLKERKSPSKFITT
jgi:hypothetical protein